MRTNAGKSARSGALLTGLGWLLLYIGVMFLILNIAGTSPRLYFAFQTRAGVLPAAGVSDRELIRIDTALAEYLSGNIEALEDTPFNTNEIDHMQDCFDLFLLLRRVIRILLCAGVIFIVAGIFPMGYRGIRACRNAAMALLLILLGFVTWGMINFNALFTLFHKLLFRNDLWLMDPATDLMIRICPESMFSGIAVIVAGGTLLFILTVIMIHYFILNRNRRHGYAGL